MQIIEIPVFNEDGSIKVTHLVSPEEAKTLLQFALNFLASAGLTTAMLSSQAAEQQERPTFDD
jgi:hypothetical protein